MGKSRFNFKMGVGKPRGLKAARKLHTKRRLQLWNDKDYNKRNLITKWRKPFQCASHAKGIVVEKVGVEAKQPNSAVRKAVKVQLKKNGKKVTAFCPLDGTINYINENDEVVIAGLGKGPLRRRLARSQIQGCFDQGKSSYCLV